MYNVWVIIPKSGWILTGNYTCMSGYAYILKFPFQVVSCNYSRKREAGIFIDLLVLWVFFENLLCFQYYDFLKLITPEAVQNLVVIF